MLFNASWFLYFLPPGIYNIDPHGEAHERNAKQTLKAKSPDTFATRAHARISGITLHN